MSNNEPQSRAGSRDLGYYLLQTMLGVLSRFDENLRWGNGAAVGCEVVWSPGWVLASFQRGSQASLRCVVPMTMTREFFDRARQGSHPSSSLLDTLIFLLPHAVI